MFYRNYDGRTLYENVSAVVDKAFYKIYRHSEDNWYRIESIKLDYCVVEDDTDLPFVEVVFVMGTTADGQLTITFDYRLDESEDFNVGLLYLKLTECDE